MSQEWITKALQTARYVLCTELCMRHEVLATSHHPDCMELTDMIRRRDPKAS